MEQKSILWSILTVMMIAMISVSFVACGGDDDDDVNEPRTSDNEKGNESSTDVLIPGIYFGIDASDIHQQCSDAVTMGNTKGIEKIINENGKSGWDICALKVVEGDLLDFMYVYASLKKPSNNMTICCEKYYFSTKVYYYVDEGENLVNGLHPWEPSSTFQYIDGQFVQTNFLGKDAVYYVKVK